MEHHGSAAEGTQGRREPPPREDGSAGAAGHDAADTSHSGGAGGYGQPDDPIRAGDGAEGGHEDSAGSVHPGGRTTGSGTMTVELAGQTRELPAEKDYTGDGRPDAATETSDGKVIIFADTEDNATGEAGPDGKADEAYVVDKATGKVVGAAHIDPGSGKWVVEVVEDDRRSPLGDAGSGDDGGDGDGPPSVGSPAGTAGSGS